MKAWVSKLWIRISSFWKNKKFSILKATSKELNGIVRNAYTASFFFLYLSNYFLFWFESNIREGKGNKKKMLINGVTFIIKEEFISTYTRLKILDMVCQWDFLDVPLDLKSCGTS